MSKKTGVIYAIENKVNGKIYIGLTRNYTKRKWEHLNNLEKGRHHNNHLQCSYQKYGKNNFEFKIIENNIPDKLLSVKEKMYIKKLNTFKKGYNATKGGEEITGEDNYFYNNHFTGEDNPRALSKEKVLRIYEEYKNNKNISSYELSEKYNLHRGVIGKITRGDHWATKNQKSIHKSFGREGNNNANSKISKEKALKIYKEYQTTNIGIKELKNKYNTSKGTIYYITHGKHWATKKLGRIKKKGSKLNEYEALNIYKEYKENPRITYKDLAEKYNRGTRVIAKIVNNKHKYTKKLKKDNKPGNGILNKEIALKIYNEQKNKNTTYKKLAEKYKVSISTIGRIVNCNHWTTEHLKGR